MRFVRKLMLLEAALNTLTGLLYMLHPSTLAQGPRVDTVSNTSPEAWVWGMFGSVIISQAVVLVMGAYGSEAEAKMAYWMLVVGEMALMPLLRGYFNSEWAVWNASAYAFFMPVAGFLVARLYVLLLRPDLMTGSSKQW